MPLSTPEIHEHPLLSALPRTSQTKGKTVNAPTTVEDLLRLYEDRGHAHYGESVDQVEHGLQCAALAKRDGAPNELIAAALLHDVGHLVTESHDTATPKDHVDDDHESVGAALLGSLFGPAVAGPVALHVVAKRWRCTKDPDYHERLSSASKITFEIQGGLLSPHECNLFESDPHFGSALALRSWDDQAKIQNLDVGNLREYQGLLTRLAVVR